jgi:hypothetical protein
MMFFEERFPLSVIMNNFQTKGKNETLERTFLARLRP